MGQHLLIQCIGQKGTLSGVNIKSHPDEETVEKEMDLLFPSQVWEGCKFPEMK